ncbi:MAG: LysR family transcriptional regulator [Piscinibacter sp.]|nr:LysR family transcriptional regulator [Piscinibacter sp.]
MDKLESLHVFVAVAQAGGFSAAARALGLPVPTVSRKVAELEEALGVRLFERSTRSVVLTEVAQPYFESCRRLLDDLRDADEAVSGSHRAPKGELTITAPVGFGRQHVQPVALEFMRAYPEIDLRLQLVDRLVDLVDEHVDVALRISELPDSSLAARPVGHIRMIVCASPAYLQQHGVPRHPSELGGHSAILWSSLGARKAWLFRDEGQDTMFPIRVRLTTTLPESAIDAAQAGLGLTQVASYQAEAAVRAGTLVPVLREHESAPTPVSLVHPSNRRVPLKLRAFLDFAAPRLSERLRVLAQLL